MTKSVFEEIEKYCRELNLGITAGELAALSESMNMDEHELQDIKEVFRELVNQKNEAIINTCLRLSRLPVKVPKTFENFDFGRLKGKEMEKLKSLSTLAPLYEHRNLAFIGSPGIGKTHLAQAFGRACCEKGLKTYFIKATELNQRLTAARHNDRVARTVNGLVKPSCLIIDEIGRCTFNAENTRLFFDIIDRRANKDAPNCIIFTSNKTPDLWKEYFQESDSLLCALDRIFDDALVFMMRGESYRGRKLETVSIETQNTVSLLNNSR